MKDSFDSSQAVTKTDIQSLIKEEADNLEIILPEGWQTDFENFYNGRKPLQTANALTLLCKGIDAFLIEENFFQYNTPEILGLRKSVHKRIWIMINPEIKIQLERFLREKKLNFFYPSLLEKGFYNKLRKAGIVDEEDYRLLLGEDATLLDKIKFQKQESTDWTQEELEGRLSNFFLYALTPYQKWELKELKIYDPKLANKIQRDFKPISKDTFISILGEVGLELLEIYPFEKREILYPDLNSIQKGLLKFIDTELKPGYRWNLTTLKEFDSQLYKRIMGLKLSSPESLENLIGSEFWKLFPYQPLESKWIRKATGESHQTCNEEIAKKAMLNFFREAPEAQKEWGPALLEKWSKDFVRYLTSKHRLKDRPHWQEILQIYVPLEYQPTFSYKEKTIKDATGEDALNWDQRLARIAMLNFFRQVEPIQGKWNSGMLSTWNNAFCQWLRTNHRLENGPDWETILKNYVILDFRKNFVWQESHIKQATGENTNNWNEKLAKLAISNFFNQVPESQKKWGPKMLGNWNHGFYTWLIQSYRLDSQPDWELILERFVPIEYRNNFSWENSDILKATGKKSFRWDKNLGEIAMCNFFIEVDGAKEFWTPCLIAKWNKGFYSWLIRTYRLDGQPDWGSILGTYIDSEYWDKFIWEDNLIFKATGENNLYWNEKLIKNALINFFLEVPNARKKWNPSMLYHWNKGVYKWLTRNYRKFNQIDWQTILNKYVDSKYCNKFIWKKEKINFTKQPTERTYSLEFIENMNPDIVEDISLETSLDITSILKLVESLDSKSQAIITGFLNEDKELDPELFDSVLLKIRSLMPEFQNEIQELNYP